MLAPGQRFGSFVVGKVLSESHLAPEFLAEWLETGRPVALQILAVERLASIGGEAGVARFLAEAKSFRESEHPGVQKSIGEGRVAELLWVSRDALPADTHGPAPPSLDGGLAARWEGGPFARIGASPTDPAYRPSALALLADLAARVDTLHGRGVVHGAIEAVHVRGGGAVPLVLTGFDAGWLLRRMAPQSSFLGFKGIMTPERIEGKPAQPATDVFCLAALCWEVLVGQRFFAAGSLQASLFRIVEGPEAPAREVLPRNAFDVLKRGLARQPGERWPSCGELVAALSGALEAE